MTKRAWIAVTALAVACTGRIDREGDAPAGADDGSGGGAGSRSSGSGRAGAAASPTAGSFGAQTSGAPAPETGGSDVDPQRIFACGENDDGASPQRLWRLTGTQYYNAVAVAFGGRQKTAADELRVWFPLAVPFEQTTPDRFTTYSYGGTMSDSELRRALDTAGLISENLIADNHSCLHDGAVPSDDCVQTLGSRLFSRPLDPDEVAHYRQLATDAEALQKGDGGKLVAEAMLMSPHFLFRREIGRPSGGLNKLSSYEVAAALSYSLTQAPPDELLWAAAQKDALATPEQVGAQVVRLMGKPADAPTVMRFFREYFKYPQAANVFKDGKGIDGWSPSDLIADTDALVKSVLTTNAQKALLKTLLTTNAGFMGSYTDYVYGKSIGNRDRAPQATTFPATERAGILTQPTFLAAFSGAAENKPVQRGKFISESLLCRPTPSLPIGMIPQIPEDANRTLRDKLAVHTKDAGCAACHKLMDPIGVAFEIYDHYGRLRTTEAGHPADGSGVLTDSGNQDGTFKTPIELAAKLAASDVVEGCFARHSFRYWLGRNEQPTDACTMASSLDAYRKGGGDYVALVTAIFASPSFFNRLSP